MIHKLVLLVTCHLSLGTVLAFAQMKADYPLLTWDKVPAGEAVLYIVERALNANPQAGEPPSPWTPVGLTDRNFFLDAQTLPGLSYSYRIIAQAADDPSVRSEPSDEDVRYLMPSKLPAPRFELEGVANASELRNVFYRSAGQTLSVPFVWDQNYVGRITGFYVYRATGLSTSKTRIAILDPSARQLVYTMPGGSTAEYRLELVAVTRDVVTGAAKEYGASSEQVILRRLK